jgi:hypothetical protein
VVIGEAARCFFAARNDAIGPFLPRRSAAAAAAFGGKADIGRPPQIGLSIFLVMVIYWIGTHSSDSI